EVLCPTASPDGQSRSPIVAAEARQVEKLEESLVTGPIQGFCAQQLSVRRVWKRPTVGDALQFALARLGEREAGSRREVLDRRGHEDLGGFRGGRDPRADDDGHPAGFAIDRLDLAGMHARTDLDAEEPDGIDSRKG